MISLTVTGHYKDGGSKDLVDKNTKKKYYLNNKIGSKDRGKLYEVDSKGKKTLAKGEFAIIGCRVVKMHETIESKITQ